VASIERFRQSTRNEGHLSRCRQRADQQCGAWPIPADRRRVRVHFERGHGKRADGGGRSTTNRILPLAVSSTIRAHSLVSSLGGVLSYRRSTFRSGVTALCWPLLTSTLTKRSTWDHAVEWHASKYEPSVRIGLITVAVLSIRLPVGLGPSAQKLLKSSRCPLSCRLV
jgi:hypothetical protein